jgi:hypothetical protein
VPSPNPEDSVSAEASNAAMQTMNSSIAIPSSNRPSVRGDCVRSET